MKPIFKYTTFNWRVLSVYFSNTSMKKSIRLTRQVVFYSVFDVNGLFQQNAFQTYKCALKKNTCKPNALRTLTYAFKKPAAYVLYFFAYC